MVKRIYMIFLIGYHYIQEETAILRGVEANKYYLKNSGVKQYPTQLFEGIGAHHSNLAKEKIFITRK